MPRDKVFISYSHKDEKWRDDLRKHLKPYLRSDSIVSWSDEQIVPGSEWFKEIQSALANSKLAVLLVSPDFLDSDFIDEHELGPLLKEAEQGGVQILWVPVRDSAYKETSLDKYQALLDPRKPLAGMPKAKRDQAWVKVCKKIDEAVNPRRKLEKDVKQVKERQERQEGEISGIKIALKGILTKHELGPIQGLNGDEPVMIKMEPELYGYLHRLDGLNFIQPNEGYGLIDIVNIHKHELDIPPDNRRPFDLKKYVHITDEGRRYLKTLNDLGAIAGR